jgi:putative redox protein
MGEKRDAVVILTDNKVHFQGTSRTCAAVDIDYPPPFGEGDGYTSLEIFLMSLASCSGTSVALLLRKMGKTINGLKVSASGVRKDQHPTSFESIHLTFNITSDNVDELSVKKALKTSEETLCPVWAMIKNNVTVTTEFAINQQVSQMSGNIAGS